MSAIRKTAAMEDRCHIIHMQLCGNYIYYEKYDNKSAVSLEKIKINKKEKQTVIPEMILKGGRADLIIYVVVVDIKHVKPFVGEDLHHIVIQERRSRSTRRRNRPSYRR